MRSDYNQCSIDGCDKPVRTRELCAMHYNSQRLNGSIKTGWLPPVERFWSKVEKTDTCWLWKGALVREHGVFWFKNRNVYAHRFCYELLVGPIPERMEVDHLCRVPYCVNPAHLEPVPQRINTLRGIGITAVNAVKTHCPQGHAYDLLNTKWHQGRRYCMTCRMEASAARTQR